MDAYLTTLLSGDNCLVRNKLKDLITADAIDHNGSPTGEDIKGGDSIIAMLGQIHSSFQPGLKFNIISQAVDGDYLFTLSEMIGTTSANPGMGMPANTKMDSKSVDVVKLKDGKAAEHWSFMSPADMMKMMSMGKEGMTPPPVGDKKMGDSTKK